VIDTLTQLLTEHREALYVFFRRLRAIGHPFVSRPELEETLRRFLASDAASELEGTGFAELAGDTHEVVLDDPLVYVSIRHDVARWTYLQVHTEELRARMVSVSEFLGAKERLVRGQEQAHVLEIDLQPFERGFPRLTRSASIGRGVEFLNRHLSGRLFEGDREGLKRLVGFLQVHQVSGRQLMLNGQIGELNDLLRILRKGLEITAVAAGTAAASAEDAREWQLELRRIGFEPGWGRTPERAHDTMELLLDLLEAPEPRQLARFLARIPMITSIAIVSPHGYFGQANVLGKPDTGGQVVYILDQVRALEHAMRSSLHEQGIDIEPQIVVLTRLLPESDGTTCGQRLEPIIGTETARILRVPFRNEDGGIVRPWISRFEIWPYLERFAIDAERELLAELGARPDFIIGNYSDGNLVASLMARRLGITQCNIAHALEKTKYENSDLEWEALEEEHHFSCQFTADLIAMNTADFIITSTYQEIAGTSHSIGQYESYQSFTLPGLYRVVSGIDCFDPKFNVVSPGANPDVFFPYWETSRRPRELTEEMRAMVFGSTGAAHRGDFEDASRPLLFAMSRLDRIKNVAGLLDWYGRNDRLRERANLLVVGGWLDPARSSDVDEARQIERVHALMDEHALDREVRWVEMQTDKNRVGEIYRVVADTRGAFVQPALFEAFGLTVVEAMSSGLPVFATLHGGPLEIVEDGVSGFHIDPNRGDEAAVTMCSFLERSAHSPELWKTLSCQAVARVQERYNWHLYASRLLELSRIYGFWKYITSLERDETARYLEMFYALMFRPLARTIGERETADP